MIDDRTISHLIVHATLTAPSEEFSFDRMVANHYERGVRTSNPDSRSGYHFVIQRDGSLITGRRMSEPARLSGALNESAVAVCLVGGLSESGEHFPSFTGAQVKSLGKIYDELRELYPDLVALGHRDVAAKGKPRVCPCFDVQTWAVFHEEVQNDSE